MNRLFVNNNNNGNGNNNDEKRQVLSREPTKSIAPHVGVNYGCKRTEFKHKKPQPVARNGCDKLSEKTSFNSIKTQILWMFVAFVPYIALSAMEIVCIIYKLPQSKRGTDNILK